VSARTEAAFAALVGLDPLGGGRGAEQAAWRAEPADHIDTDAEACIARIIATPRPGAVAEPAARRAPPWARAAPRRRTRYGAIGLVASAAIAVVTTMLWASPSAGAPPDRAVNVPAQAAPAQAAPAQAAPAQAPAWT
jgi:hypothetical protein